MGFGRLAFHSTFLGLFFSLALLPPHLWGPEDGLLKADGPVFSSSSRPLSGPSHGGFSKVVSSGQPKAAPRERAIPLYVHEAGLPAVIQTTASTVEQGLVQGGVEIYPGDLILPGPDVPPSAGMHVYLFRAREVTLHADGAIRQARTRARTVGKVLEAEDVTLGLLDRVEPAPNVELQNGMGIKVVRVREELVEQVERLGFATEYRPDPEMELDERVIVQEGRVGSGHQLFWVHYEDGQEVSLTLERAWADPEPRTRVVRYGTKIVVRSLDAPEGQIQYWRKIRVWATWYNASHGGKPKGHPQYGLTRAGMVATQGVVAVDPRVVPLLTTVYVPGYGVAVAGDTGGGVKGRIIDLAFDEGITSPWVSRWLDVYLLAPVPPPEAIPWVLPE